MKKTRITKTCEICGKQFDVQLWRFRRNPNEGRFCSLDCFGISCRGKPTWNKGQKMSEEISIKLSKAHQRQGDMMRGIPKSIETKKKMSNAWMGRKRDRAFCIAAQNSAIKRHENGVYKAQNTAIEKIVEMFLNDLGIPYKSQKNIGGPYVVDFFIEKYNLVIEADGDYWHANPIKYSVNNIDAYQSKKIKRDNSLDALIKKRGWTIIHFWEFDLWSDPERCKRILIDTIDTLENHINTLLNGASICSTSGSNLD